MTLVIVKPFGDYEQGSVVDNLPDDVANSLLDGGYAVEAPEDAPAEDGETVEAGKGLSKAEEKIAKSVAENVIAKMTKQPSKFELGTVPATPKDHKGGFKNFGDYLRCMGSACKGDWNASRKMSEFRAKAATGQNVTTAGDGGYIVPEEWANTIFEKARQELYLVDYCKEYTSGTDTVHIPTVNDNSRADGSRPLRYYKVAEGNDYTASKIAFGERTLGLYKYGILAAATEEQIADSMSNIEGIITDQIGKELRFCLNEQIINGDGDGDPQGVLAATPVVSVAKEGSQTAATINYPNLVNMWSRLYAPSRSNAVWLVNQEVMAQLLKMVFPTASGTASAFGGLTFTAADEFPMRIFNRPVLECEHCAALGTVGDIILADFSQMAFHMKPLQIAASPHVNFVNGEVLYRAFVRFDCDTLWENVLTPYKGSATLAPFITLATRS